jgi:glycosyltransferase involved in cell wall biosynthesis
MRNVYIGHSYQRKTRSSDWLIRLIRQHSKSLDVIWDEEWIGGPPVPYDDILKNDYDRIFVFQLPYVVSKLAAKASERLFFIPMYDGTIGLSDAFWRSLNDTRILNLSWVLHTKLSALGLQSEHAQYFPNPALYKTTDNFSKLHGFFWLRRPNLSWPIVRELAFRNKWSSFHFHNAPDPDLHDPVRAETAQVPAHDRTHFHMTFSGWQKDRSSFNTILNKANIVFASRRAEGIGMLFLEAMARGQCVVAPNGPTYSEYITHEVSGLLYNPDDPRPIDFASAKTLGIAARRKIEIGYSNWKYDLKERLPEFLLGGAHPNRPIKHRQRITALPNSTNKIATRHQRALTKTKGQKLQNNPLVTVAIVIRNAATHFEKTLQSIVSQTYPNIEVVVVDGASTDGTVGLIKKNSRFITKWISEPDDGPYDGMNKASRLAQGHWTIYMNAGDLFYSSNAILNALRWAPNNVDFIIGHHIYCADGIEHLSKANHFDRTWRLIRTKNFGSDWLGGLPCHQATFTKTTLLVSNGGYRYAEFPVAADHEFTHRMKKKGATFFHCDEIIAIYYNGGFSQQNSVQCHRDWWHIAHMYGKNIDRIDRYFWRTFSLSRKHKMFSRLILGVRSFLKPLFG